MADIFVYDPDHPLDRCAGEQRQAHDSLLDYWRMGSGRSLRVLLERYRTQAASGEDSIKPPTRRFATIFKWSRENLWQDRMTRQTEIDLEAERQARADALKAEAAKWAERRLAVRERDWGQAEQLRELAEGILKEAPKFKKNSRRFIAGKEGEPDREVITLAIDAKLMVSAIEAASKLQRLAAEMETEHTLAETTDAEDIEKVRQKRWADVQEQLTDAIDSQPDAAEGDDTDAEGDDA